ncbi:hypothetical protein MKS83_14480 [Chryseobacterium sp. Y16C]|uniref:hypothetical protein n=1 Tax=Chryseobacterium sp. Y16C TaxID=2920939 RepID=UPI001F0AA414|nr:hypothetical protein [Chryseobacterium sp. Y16C]UMQ40601.1 hypothetical protein MKS83_14480 [Chryseobacterium sp. Y16C]
MQEFITYNYIRNKIKKFSRKELLISLYSLLKRVDLKDDNKPSAIWQVFLLIKWTYLNGEEPYKPKKLSDNEILQLLNYIEKFESTTLNPYVKKHDWDSFFQIIGYQQLYLQKQIHWVYFAQQLKLYTSIISKYNIEKSFLSKTGITIYDFLATSFILWMYTNMNSILKQYTYNGFIGTDVYEAYSYCLPTETLDKYLKLLLLEDKNAQKIINSYKKSLIKNEFQPFEISFFTMFPFQNLSNSINIIHKSIFAHTCCYYIYDYLKENDESFTEEFGKRLEKYIEIGLLEAKINFITENELRILYGKNEKVVDYLVDDCVLIECKGIEPKPLPSVNPSINLVYNALKDSIIKAYTQQMLNVIKNKKNEKEYFGIIITYKTFYYSSLQDLWEILKDDVEKFCTKNNLKKNPLPPENVFIIDLLTWDKIVQILKNENISLFEILKQAKNSNNIEKSLIFSSHLDKFEMGTITLNYLQEEYKKFDILFSKNKS